MGKSTPELSLMPRGRDLLGDDAVCWWAGTVLSFAGPSALIRLRRAKGACVCVCACSCAEGGKRHLLSNS